MEESEKDVSASLLGSMFGRQNVGVAEGLVNLVVIITRLAAKAMVETLANDSAKGDFEFLFGSEDKIFSREDSSGIKANLGSIVDAAEIGEFKVEEPVGQVEMLKDDEAIGLHHVGRKLGEEVVWRDSDRGCDAFADLIEDRVFHLHR